ncbi:NAD(P)/FAD-dependent oxidoreductase [Rhodococcus erythropolis]|uniref:NAD(P)/FAD-dependent oxidoreductase n=1 Tax=Rhodococcus erythropolis TaxID=1833 RepID=UPI0009BF1FEA|nr:FAD-binding oxidoreductase [Rhodococcus erythropolis]
MRHVVVVGSGIVGISVASELARRAGMQVTVLERDIEMPRGSTTFAPGFVGQYNDVPLLSELAERSMAVYDTAGPAFTRSGGMELATSDRGANELERRVRASVSLGLEASMLAGGDIPESIAAFVDSTQIVAAAYFPRDGVTKTTELITTLRAQAVSAGARFLSGQEVTGIDCGSGQVTVSAASGEKFNADDLILAGGVWGPTLAGLVGLELPLFPVSHPYVYSGRNRDLSPGPFVRWPDRHIYARTHTSTLGIGSYDHHPVAVTQNALTDGASLNWLKGFDPVVDSAMSVLRREARFQPDRRINGVFAMTPDNLPFLGPHPAFSNVWIAQAIWVTHAAGAASLLAQSLVDSIDLPPQLRVDRFGNRESNALRGAALRLYRDIYSNDSLDVSEIESSSWNKKDALGA